MGSNVAAYAQAAIKVLLQGRETLMSGISPMTRMQSTNQLKSVIFLFNSCCRQYAIELLLQGEITKLCTPDLVILEPCLTLECDEWTANVTDPYTLENITAKISGVRVAADKALI